MQRNIKNKHNKKRVNTKKSNEDREAQAALDYLMSWGWILIIIVLVLLILFSLGVFRVPSAPTIISGFQGITMQAAQANSTMMVVKITNNYNQFVNITGITVNVNGNTYTSYYCLDSIISTGQSTLCRVPVSIPTSSYLSKVLISFTPYKSSIYEVSNGTVSSTLVSGAIPINNQLTYFVERGLPYGSTFTVNYNTSTNSTTVSSIKDNVSFNLPFGSYYFSVPSVTYQGCASTPSPSAGYHSTGVEQVIAFTSNCTTTFSETGLPSSQTWQVTYNGTTKSSSTGSTIQIKTNNTANAQVYYTATAKSGNLACVSYKTPSIRLGGSYTFSAWNCTTTFSETGLPSSQTWQVSNYDGASSSLADTGSPASITQTGITTISDYTATAKSGTISCVSDPSITAEQGTSGNTFTTWQCTTTFTESGLPSSQNWNTTYDSASAINNTGKQISFTQSGITTVSSYNSEAYSSNLDCNSYVSPSILQGSSYTFNAWDCTTTFSETGLPSGQDWYATYDGTLPTVSTGSSTSTTQKDITTVSYYTGEGYSSNLACVSYDTPSEYQGSSYTFNAWNCTTTFVDTGDSVGMQQFSTQWTIKWNGQRGEASNGNLITFSNHDVSSVGTYSYQQPFTQNNVLCVGNSGNAEMGTEVKLGANWECYTMIAGNEVFSEFPLPNANYAQTVSTSPGSNSEAYSGNNAYSIVYDPQNNLYYVALYQDVMVINDSTDAEVAVINPPYPDAYPAVLTYANGLVFVLNTACPSAKPGGCSDTSTVNVISGESYLSTNTSINGGVLTFQMGYNPDANTLWIPTYTSSGVPEIAIVQADSSATFNNYLGNPWNSNSLWSGNPVYDPNNKEIYVSGSYGSTDFSGAHAEIAAYWAVNGSCQDCTIDLSSAIGSEVWTQAYIPFRVYGVGHTDFIYAGTGGSSEDKIAMLNLSNFNSIPTFTLDDDILTSYYDGAYNSGYAFPWSWFYTLNCNQNSVGTCTSDPILYGTSTENPSSSNLSIGLDNNDTAGAIGGVVTDPVTVKFESFGLPGGTGWGITYAGYSEDTTSQNLTFAVAPGNSYTYKLVEDTVCADLNIYATTTPVSSTASPGSLVQVDWYNTENPC